MKVEERFAQLHRVAQHAGGEVASEFAGWVDREDMTQEALTWLYEHDELVERATFEDGEVHHLRLVSEVKRYLVPLARRERTYRAGGSQDDDAKYTNDTVRLVLPAVWTGENPEASTDEIRAKTIASRGNTWAAMVLDVRGALKATVGMQDQALLFRHYVTGDDWSTVGEATASSAEAVKKRASRSIAAMVDHLNGLEPETYSWGRRAVMPNASWRAVADHSYQDGGPA